MDVCGKEYEVIRLLGHGKGGYSYLVTDGEAEYVLKQIHHEPCNYYHFTDKLQSELRDYRRLKTVGIPMPRLIAVDEAKERILKEYVDGPTIYDLVELDGMVPNFWTQMQDMCAKLYREGLNIDYFPTNFVVQDGTLFYVDYECNEYMQQWDFEHWGSKYWSKTEEFLTYQRQRSEKQEG